MQPTITDMRRRSLQTVKPANGQTDMPETKFANGQDGHAMKKRTCVDQGGGVGGQSEACIYNKEASRISSRLLKVAATYLCYSPTTCSTIGVAELGVGVCCCGAVWRGAHPAQPLPQGVWGARRTISGRTVRQAWNVVGHGRHSYRGTHTWMAETDPYMGARRTIHVSQARQQSASAGETEDGTGGMAETERWHSWLAGA